MPGGAGGTGSKAGLSTGNGWQEAACGWCCTRIACGRELRLWDWRKGIVVLFLAHLWLGAQAGKVRRGRASIVRAAAEIDSSRDGVVIARVLHLGIHHSSWISAGNLCEAGAGFFRDFRGTELQRFVVVDGGSLGLAGLLIELPISSERRASSESIWVSIVFASDVRSPDGLVVM